MTGDPSEMKEVFHTEGKWKEDRKEKVFVNWLF